MSKKYITITLIWVGLMAATVSQVRSQSISVLDTIVTDSIAANDRLMISDMSALRLYAMTFNVLTDYVDGRLDRVTSVAMQDNLDGTFSLLVGMSDSTTDTITSPRFIIPGDNVSELTNDAGYLTTEANDLTAAVTWANVPDVNITESSVAQHEAALSITESQISDLAHTTDTDDQTASEVAFTPDGDIAATDVQNAIVEARNDTDTKLTGKANTSHNHAAGDVNSGTFADGRIAESNVTQHEAALTITESQISDLTHTTDTDDQGIDLLNYADDTLSIKLEDHPTTYKVEIVGGAGSEVNDLTAAVTWANVPDVNITESSVAQHEAALSITESQISDLAHTTDTDDQTASEVAFTPDGDIAATDVQNAIVEARNDTDTKLTGKANTSHNHAASDVNSGTFADARIAESNVTQHEAALSITESQISDLAHTTDTDDQTLSINGYQLSISEGNAVALPDSLHPATRVSISPVISGYSADDVDEQLRAMDVVIDGIIALTLDGITINSEQDVADTSLMFQVLPQDDTFYVKLTKIDSFLLKKQPNVDFDKTDDVTLLNDLTDVANSTPADKHLLVYDGVTDNRYENRLLTEADISDLQNYLTTESNDLTSAVTWANVPDANITQTSVRQHVEDATYGAGWNGDLDAPSKNAVYDKIETLGGGHDAVTLAGTPDYITLSGQELTRNQIDLTTDVTGVLPQSNFAVTGDWTGTLDGYEAAALLDNTDAQDLTLTGNTLAVTGDPNTDVDISAATAVAANSAKVTESTTVNDQVNGLDISLSTYDISVSLDPSEVANQAPDLADLLPYEDVTDGGIHHMTLTQLQTAIDTDTDTDDQTASEVAFTPDGDIAATDVQNAIVEARNDTDTKLTGKANTSHNHAAGDVNSGTFADARIAESNVTQHEAALTITESQISDLAHTTDTDDQTASEVAFTPDGDIAATDVQNAIVESRNDTDTKLTGKANTSHNHAASDVNSGTFADGRIAESNVTQHEAALTITESQISDLTHTTDTNTLGADGDKGDATIGGTGTTITIDNDVVTNAKLADVATATIKGRITAATGDPEDLTASQVRTLINVADGATANSADGTLLARANHTGTQLASTISDFSSAVAATASVTANTAKVTESTTVTDQVNGLDISLSTYDISVDLDISELTGQAPDLADEIVYEDVTDGGVHKMTLTQLQTAIDTDTDTNTLGPDGDKGDITVGGTGTTLTIDNSTITSAKILDGTIAYADLAAALKYDAMPIAISKIGTAVSVTDITPPWVVGDKHGGWFLISARFGCASYTSTPTISIKKNGSAILTGLTFGSNGALNNFTNPSALAAGDRIEIDVTSAGTASGCGITLNLHIDNI